MLRAVDCDAHLVVRLEANPATLVTRIRAREPASWSGLEGLVAHAQTLAADMPGPKRRRTCSQHGRHTSRGRRRPHHRAVPKPAELDGPALGRVDQLMVPNCRGERDRAACSTMLPLQLQASGGNTPRLNRVHRNAPHAITPAELPRARIRGHRWTLRGRSRRRVPSLGSHDDRLTYRQVERPRSRPPVNGVGSPLPLASPVLE